MSGNSLCGWPLVPRNWSGHAIRPRSESGVWRPFTGRLLLRGEGSVGSHKFEICHSYRWKKSLASQCGDSRLRSSELDRAIHYLGDRLVELFHVGSLAELRKCEFTAASAHLHPKLRIRQ